MSRGKKLIGNTLILGLGKFLPQLTSLITLPIYTGILLSEEYGRYDLINTIVYILDIIVLVQIQQAVFRFLIDARKTDKASVYISTTYAFEIIPSIISSVVFGLFFLHLSIETAILLSLYNFICLQYSIVGQVARGLGYNKTYAFGAVIQSVLNMILVVLLMCVLNFGFNGLILSLDISYLIGTIVQFIICKQWKYLQKNSLNLKSLKEMLGFSWPMVPNTLSIWIINTCDKFIVRIFLGLEYNGIFAVAQKIPNIFTMAYSTFNLAWQESASITVKDKDYDKYYNEVFSALFDFLTGCILILIAASPVLFKILIHGSYEEAYDQMPLLYFGVFFSSLSSFFGSIYIAKKATKAVGVSSAIGAVINAIVNISFVHFIGLYAASISTIVSYLALVVYRVVDIERKKYVHIEYKKKRIILCMMLIILCSVLCYMKNPVFNIVNIVIAIVSFVILNLSFIRKVILFLMKKRKK